VSQPPQAIAGVFALAEQAGRFSQQHLLPAPLGQGLDQARASAAATGAASAEAGCA